MVPPQEFSAQGGCVGETMFKTVYYSIEPPSFEHITLIENNEFT